jgi:hypothetical protein
MALYDRYLMIRELPFEEGIFVNTVLLVIDVQKEYFSGSMPVTYPH